MAEIRLLYRPDESVFKRLISGYSSSLAYQVSKQEEAELTRFELERRSEPLARCWTQGCIRPYRTATTMTIDIQSE